MTDPLPPKPGSSWASKHPTTRKRIFWGCGCATLGLVVLGAIFGYTLWRINQAIDEVETQGETYVRGRPETVAEFGLLRKVERTLRKNMQVKGDQGEAFFTYAITGEKASGEAQVRLVKSAGQWQPVGAKLVVGGKTVLIGTPERKD